MIRRLSPSFYEFQGDARVTGSVVEHREEILFDMAKTYYDYAENSVTEKQRERYESCIEHCNTLAYLYPESKYMQDIDGIATKARKKLEKLQ